MSAKVSQLSKLHEAFAEMLMDDIKFSREEGIPMSAGDKAVIASFLRQNGISADPDEEGMKALREEFEEENKRVAAARKKFTDDKGKDYFAGLIN